MTKNLQHYEHYDILVTSNEAASYLGVKPKTMPIWRCLSRQGKKAPNIPYIRVGRLIKYKLCELDKYLNSREVRNDK